MRKLQMFWKLRRCLAKHRIAPDPESNLVCANKVFKFIITLYSYKTERRALKIAPLLTTFFKNQQLARKVDTMTSSLKQLLLLLCLTSATHWCQAQHGDPADNACMCLTNTGVNVRGSGLLRAKRYFDQINLPNSLDVNEL